MNFAALVRLLIEFFKAAKYISKEMENQKINDQAIKIKNEKDPKEKAKLLSSFLND